MQGWDLTDGDRIPYWKEHKDSIKWNPHNSNVGIQEYCYDAQHISCIRLVKKRGKLTEEDAWDTLQWSGNQGFFFKLILATDYGEYDFDDKGDVWDLYSFRDFTKFLESKVINSIPDTKESNYAKMHFLDSVEDALVDSACRRYTLRVYDWQEPTEEEVRRNK